MKFNRIFYDSRFYIKSIPKKRIIISISIGLISAIFIYSFFSLFREYFRMMNLDFENRPIVISEVNRNFHNLFFAAISLIFGNSIAISLLISRPQSALSKRNIKRGRIINDQVFLAFNFIYWFGKIWVLLGVFSFLTIGFDYFKNLMIPAILLIVVLYLESWKTLIQILKENRWKIQGIHLLVFIILTFILSRINVIDYKSFDASMLASNPTVDVPSSLYLKDNHRRYYYDNLVLKMDFVSGNQVAIFNEFNEPIEWSNLHKIVLDYNEQNSYNLGRTWVRLRANKNIPIKYVKEFEFILLNVNQWRIAYEVANDDELTASYYNNHLDKHISPSLYEVFPRTEKSPLPLFSDWNFYKDQKFQDTLSVYISQRIEIDNLEISQSILSEKLKTHINKSSIIEYIYADNVTYQDYINVLSAHKTAVWELRVTENFDEIDEEYRHNQFNRDEELNNERSRIMLKYPFRITERFE